MTLPKKAALMSVENYLEETKSRTAGAKYSLAMRLEFDSSPKMVELDYSYISQLEKALRKLQENARRLGWFSIRISMTIINR